jgi:Ca-activated chloride channel family protein
MPRIFKPATQCGAVGYVQAGSIIHAIARGCFGAYPRRRMYTGAFLAALMVGLTCGAAAQTRFRQTVRLVTVPVTILPGSDGRTPILTASDFQILEDGVPQPIAIFDREPVGPLAIALALDVSGSTTGEMPAEKKAAIKAVDVASSGSDRLAVFAFNEAVAQRTPFTSDRHLLTEALRGLISNGGTALFDAVYLAAGQLEAEPGRHAIIVISDGGDTSSEVTLQRALHRCWNSDAVIYSILVEPVLADAGRDSGGEHALAYLADQTGGETFDVSTAALTGVLRSILDTLHQQYVLGFYASPSDDAGIHQLRVVLRNSEVKALARKGYYKND